MKKRGKILALAAIVVVGAVVLSRCGHKNTAVEYESRPTVKVENPVRQGISLYTDLTGLVTVVTHGANVYLPLAELVDLEKEKARMEKELKKNSDELQKLNTKLANPGFVNKAPEHVVKAEQERSVQLTELVAKLKEQLSGM